MKHQNDMTKIPAAACGRCGGWTSQGGVSQFSNVTIPQEGSKGDFRTGCDCHSENTGMTPFGHESTLGVQS